MSHRRFHSQGNVPFSWEDSPGVSKVTHQECHTNARLNALNVPPSPTPVLRENRIITPAYDIKIPPPPPCSVQPAPPHRSSSRKGIWQQEDPFVTALKECTKSVRRGGGRAAIDDQSNNSLGFKVMKSKFKTLSCMRSCEVKDDNFVRLSNLPPLPRQRSYAGSVKLECDFVPTL